MDKENRKLNYVNDIKCIEEEPGNFEYPNNGFQDPYFSFTKMDFDRGNMRNRSLNDNNHLYENINLNENNILNINNNLI